MKIGIDASRAFLAEKTGTEEYSHELIRHLAQLENSECEFVLYIKKGAKIDFELPHNFLTREIGGNFLWTQFHLSLEMIKRKVDVLFVPSHSIPIVHPSKTVATIHGLEFKNFPDCYSLKSRIILEINTLLTIFFAKKIVVPSENTGRDLIKYYKVDLQRIKVINHGVDKNECNADRTQTADAVLRHPSQEGNQYGCTQGRGGKYSILFIGRLEKRKNIIGTVNAFDKFMGEVESSKVPLAKDMKINLILAGKAGFGFEEIERKIFGSSYKKNIVLPGYVSEKEKRRLYSDADVFIFPSLCEGFGIPILEAMSYGVPVITSSSSSLREVAGESALLVDPCNMEEISTALMKLFQDEDLRKKLIKAGYENLERFSWEKCAEETLKVLADWK